MRRCPEVSWRGVILREIPKRLVDQVTGRGSHSPLQATLLANSAREHCSGSEENHIVDFNFRAQRPLFDTDILSVCGKREGNEVKLWTRTHDGFIGTAATAHLAPGELRA